MFLQTLIRITLGLDVIWGVIREREESNKKAQRLYDTIPTSLPNPITCSISARTGFTSAYCVVALRRGTSGAGADRLMHGIIKKRFENSNIRHDVMLLSRKLARPLFYYLLEKHIFNLLLGQSHQTF